MSSDDRRVVPRDVPGAEEVARWCNSSLSIDRWDPAGARPHVVLHRQALIAWPGDVIVRQPDGTYKVEAASPCAT